MLAPIGLTVYTRLEHTKETVKALQKNTLANKSHLYIFSDGPKAGDEEKVKNMRNYLKTIEGFKEIEIVERDENSRVKNNKGGHKYLLDKYGKMIWMAEDIVTAPGYLQFMNDALDVYESRDDILSISGYAPDSLEAKKLNKDSFIFQNLLAWGMGIWKEKYAKVKAIDEKDYLELISSQKRKEYVAENCGKSFVKHFHDECYSGNNHFDVQATFLEYLEGLYTVYPKKSLVQNIGHDGSGLHSSITHKFEVDLWDKTDDFILDRDVKIDNNIKKEMLTYFSPTEDSVDKSVVNNIVEKIKASKLTSFSIWGTNQLTDLVLKELVKTDITINHFVCSWAKDDTSYNDNKVITPEEALANGETNFIIMSFASRFKMRDAILGLTNKKLNIIMYEE